LFGGSCKAQLLQGINIPRLIARQSILMEAKCSGKNYGMVDVNEDDAIENECKFFVSDNHNPIETHRLAEEHSYMPGHVVLIFDGAKVTTLAGGVTGRVLGGIRPDRPLMFTHPRPPRVGEEYKVTISEVSRGGDGVAKLYGGLIYVPGAEIGWHGKVKVTKAVNRSAKGVIVGDGSTVYSRLTTTLENGEREVRFKVLKGLSRDVGRCVIRIDSDGTDALEATEGDVVEIRGKRRTVARCLHLYPSDEGKGIVRIDALVRSNAGVTVGDSVVVKKVKAFPAERVAVVQLKTVPLIDGRYLTDELESLPVTKGDDIMIPHFGGGKFKVAEVSPEAEVVLITKRTKLMISSAKGGSNPGCV